MVSQILHTGNTRPALPFVVRMHRRALRACSGDSIRTPRARPFASPDDSAAGFRYHPRSGSVGWPDGETGPECHEHCCRQALGHHIDKLLISRNMNDAQVPKDNSFWH